MRLNGSPDQPRTAVVAASISDLDPMDGWLLVKVARTIDKSLITGGRPRLPKSPLQMSSHFTGSAISLFTRSERLAISVRRGLELEDSPRVIYSLGGGETHG